MHPMIARALGAVAVGESVSFKSLTVFPLTGPSVADPGYLTLDDALGQGVVEITEVSKGGSVPELQVGNTGSTAVLLLDGEELVGAKQNRVLNLTVLVPAGATIVIPVSCVEAGRWAYRSERFASAPRAHYARGRARRVEQVSASLRTYGERYSDQGAVWADIEEKAARLGVASDTGAMADVFERHAGSVAQYVEVLGATALHQVGAVFAVGGQVVGVDLFDSPRTLDRLLAKIVRSYALDAIEEKPLTNGVTAEHVSALIWSVREAKAESFPAVGEGLDLRLHGDGVSGAALVARERVVHLTAFRSETTGLRSSGRLRRRQPMVE